MEQQLLQPEQDLFHSPELSAQLLFPLLVLTTGFGWCQNRFADRHPDGSRIYRALRMIQGRQNNAMDHHFVGIPELTGVPRVAVVIDVMRAFTVAAWAFSRGVERIILASTESEALALKESRSGWLALKDGAPAEGFDAVNSPGLLRSCDFAGRTLVQKTTAGTVGALAVANAPLVLCASFVVAGPTARFLQAKDSGPVTFVVTGEGGQADEDLACAEYIGQCMAGSEVEAAPYLHRARTSRAAADLAGGLRSGYHPDDVDLCLEIDKFSFAMMARQEDSLTVLRPVAVPDIPSSLR